MMDELVERLELLTERLRTTYDGIGHSSGRPYVYFVYPPDQERAVRRLVDEHLRSGDAICYHHIDLLPLTVDSLKGQEEKRQALLNDPVKGAGAAQAIVRLWARQVGRALHPIGNPTSLMEAIAEHEPRDPATGQIVPFVLLAPGVRPPQTSRTYLFLGREDIRLEFYRGEEI